MKDFELANIVSGFEDNISKLNDSRKLGIIVKETKYEGRVEILVFLKNRKRPSAKVIVEQLDEDVELHLKNYNRMYIHHAVKSEYFLQFYKEPRNPDIKGYLKWFVRDALIKSLKPDAIARKELTVDEKLPYFDRKCTDMFSSKSVKMEKDVYDTINYKASICYGK